MKIKMEAIKKNYFLPVILPVLLFVISIWSIGELETVVMYADDFHYWANAAFFAGYDWSSMIRHDFYYSYGYSILLAPLFLFSDNSIVLYKMAVIENIVMLEAMFVILYRIGRKIFPNIEKWIVLLLAFAACLYPSCVLFVNFTWAEMALYLVFVLIVYFYLQIGDTSQKSVFIVLGCLNVYIFMIHQRMMTALIVSFLIMFFLLLIRRISNNQFMSFLLPVISGMGIHMLIKRQIQKYLYTDYSTYGDSHAEELNQARLTLFAEIFMIVILTVIVIYLMNRFFCISDKLMRVGMIVLVAAAVFLVVYMVTKSSGSMSNDFGSVVKRVMSVFQWGAFKKLMVAVNGHFYYLAMSSVFCVPFGVYVSLRRMRLALKKDAVFSYQNVAVGFAVLTFMLTFLLSAVMMMGNTSRIDTVMYGRYMECCLPCIILLALGYLWQGVEQNYGRVYLLLALLCFSSTYFLQIRMTNCEENGTLDDFRFVSVNSSGVSWGMIGDRYYAYLVYGVIVILALLFYRGIASAHRWRKAAVVVALCGLSVLVGKQALYSYYIPQQRLVQANGEVLSMIQETDEELPVYFIREPLEPSHVSAFVQFTYPKRSVICLTVEEYDKIQESCFIICESENCTYREMLEESGCIQLKESTLCVLYEKP